MKIDLVCESKEEASFLYSALNDFSTDGPRHRYAVWLDDHDESQKAEAVRATIRAFQDFDRDCLKDLGGNENWKRVVAIPLLETFLAAKDSVSLEKLSELRDAVFKLIRPCLALEFEKSDMTPEVGSSYLWGLPDLPGDQEWPTISE